MRESIAEGRLRVPTAEETARTTKVGASLKTIESRLALRFTEKGKEGVLLARERAEGIDTLLSELMHGRTAPCGFAAVGSYGRNAVAWKSDIDLRFLVEPKGRDDVQRFAESLLYPLWDLGLSVGHQVISAGEAIELARTDLTTATALLDARHLFGPKQGFDELLTRAWEGIFSEASLDSMVDRLESEVIERHERFGGSVYILEPDLKSGPGGLRDLDGARWAARARYLVGNHEGSTELDRGTWSALVRVGVLLEREGRELSLAEDFLFRVRNRLHMHAGRKSDRLTFDSQEILAQEMGFVEGEGERAQAAGAERLMQEFYLHARVVSRARERLCERARPPRRGRRGTEVEVAPGVQLFDGHIGLKDAALLDTDPAVAFRALQACVKHDAPLSPHTREVLSRAAGDPAFGERLRASPEAVPLFVELVCTARETKTRRGSIAQEMHDLGLLLAMLPEFAPVNGRVHHDTYHVFTVDVHSVAALDCLRALSRGELADVHPRGSRLAAEVAQPRPLFLATLLHDVGKGYPDATGSRKNHSLSGAEICDRVLPRLGFTPEETEDARALVLSHLQMYQIATRRDLDDPTTIEEFARHVRGREGLRNLYLLTIADVSTTSPTAMTSWKARMLEELYLRTDAYLSEGPGSRFDVEIVAHVREEHLAKAKEKRPLLERFLSTMPERYLLAVPTEAMLVHAAAAEARKGKATVVRVPSKHTDAAEICVIADDRPGLLARVTAAITGGRLEVLAAEVYSRTRADGVQEAVDLFVVRDRTEGAERVDEAITRLEKDLAVTLKDDTNMREFVRARAGVPAGRKSPKVLTEVLLDDRASPQHTVVEVFTKDRPGLLFTLADTLFELGLTIALSKITTEGTRASDVFYVNELDGTKVAQGDRYQQIRSELVERIEASLAPTKA